MAEMLFKGGERIALADLTGTCAFSTDQSLSFTLSRPEESAREIGWIDLHLTRLDETWKVYFRLCIPVPLSTRDRVDQIRRDCYFALALPEETPFEITVFCPEKSVTYIDIRETCFLVADVVRTPGDVPMLDFAIAVPVV